MDAFNQDDVRLLSILARNLASAIDNGQLYEYTARLKAFKENIVQGIAETILIEDAEKMTSLPVMAARNLSSCYPRLEPNAQSKWRNG